MDGNKTRFDQPQTALKQQRGATVEQVFPASAFIISAAQSLPAVRYKESGEEKL